VGDCLFPRSLQHIIETPIQSWQAKMMRGGGFRLPGWAVACCVLLDIEAGIVETGSARMQVK